MIGYMFAEQSYWYKLRGLHVYKAILLVQLRGLWFKLRRPRAFQLSRGLFTGCILIGWLRSPDGAGNPTISRETETQVPAACQPQPQQPHIKLISQLQKPTRKISDTWIIDTDKRETSYQLVKVHQTIRRHHTTSKSVFCAQQGYISVRSPRSQGFLFSLTILWIVFYTIKGKFYRTGKIMNLIQI